MSTIVTTWPNEASPGSGFAADHALCPAAPTFDVARFQLLTSLRRLRDAAKLVDLDDGWGSHILMLRPSLVLVAKAAWIVRPDGPEDRVGRTLGMLVANQTRGAAAMRDAVSQGAIPEFDDLADNFDRSSSRLSRGVSPVPIRPPGDQAMIRELGREVDSYYGSDDTSADMQLLWNASSSLAHGETWFSQLSGGHRPRRLAEVLTSRSFAAVCSGLNTTSLRLVALAANATTPTTTRG